MNNDSEKNKTLRDKVFSLQRVTHVEDFEALKVSGLSDTLMPAHEFVRHIKLYKEFEEKAGEESETRTKRMKDEECYACKDGVSGNAKDFIFIPVDKKVFNESVAKSAYLNGYDIKYYNGLPVPSQNESNFPITIDDFYSYTYPTLLELIIKCIEETVGKFAKWTVRHVVDDELDLDNTTTPSIWKYFVKCCRVDLDKSLTRKKEWDGILRDPEWNKMKETLINHIENQQNNETLREIFKHRLQLASEWHQPTEDYGMVKEVEHYWTKKMKGNVNSGNVESRLFGDENKVWRDNTVKEFNEFIYPYTMEPGAPIRSEKSDWEGSENINDLCYRGCHWVKDTPIRSLKSDWKGSKEFWPNVQHNMCLNGKPSFAGAPCFHNLLPIDSDSDSSDSCDGWDECGGCHC